ncbi:MAG TPA: DnaJ family domain-containing protein [Vicinamibacteria bacterium]|jgi:hypothetical protein
MDWLNTIAERKIREAMEEGAFDDSPMKGRPLVFETNPSVPDELRLAYKLLKDAGFLPEEMELRKEIWTLRDLLRTIDDDQERRRVALEINDRVFRLNVLWKRSFNHEDRQVYVEKLRKKLG